MNLLARSLGSAQRVFFLRHEPVRCTYPTARAESARTTVGKKHARATFVTIPRQPRRTRSVSFPCFDAMRMEQVGSSDLSRTEHREVAGSSCGLLVRSFQLLQPLLSAAHEAIFYNLHVVILCITRPRGQCRLEVTCGVNVYISVQQEG